MTDRDKVIKGLENCSIQNDFGCQGCPYLESRKQYGHEWCTTELAQDALALLKEYKRQDECPCTHCTEWECDEVCEEYKKWKDT